MNSNTPVTTGSTQGPLLFLPKKLIIPHLNAQTLAKSTDHAHMHEPSNILCSELINSNIKENNTS